MMRKNLVATLFLAFAIASSASAAMYNDTVNSYGSLINSWDFNETSGNAADSVGSISLTANGNATRVAGMNGAVTKGGAALAGFDAGNKAFSFDGNGDYLRSATNSIPAISGTSAATMMYWVKVANPAQADHQFMAGIHKPEGARYTFGNLVLGGNGSINSYAQKSASQVQGASSMALAANTWHHIAMVYGGTSLKLYIDGVERTNLPFAADTLWTDTEARTLIVGGDIAGTDFVRGLNGQIDELAFFSSALSATDINNIYDSAFVPEPATTCLVAIGGLAVLGKRKRV